MVKKFLCFLLVVSLLVNSGVSAFAADNEISVSTKSSMEDILDEYNDKVSTLKTASSDSARSYTYKSEVEQIREDTVDTLIKNGYDAYDVNPKTYKSLENELSTDLGELGLNPEYSYIIVLGGDGDTTEKTVTARNTADEGDEESSEFAYYYGGQTYLMRYVVVTGNEDPNYRKSTEIDMLQAKYNDLLANVGDYLLEVLVNSFFENIAPIGTILSLGGLSVEQIMSSPKEYYKMYFSTSWTRYYLQVYDTHNDLWMNGSCVERRRSLTHCGGNIWDTAIRDYVPRTGEVIQKTEFSNNFYDYELRKEKAVIGFHQYVTQYELVGNAEYCYTRQDGVRQRFVIHYENF